MTHASTTSSRSSMTSPSKAVKAQSTGPATARDEAEAERVLGRVLARPLPFVFLGGAVVAGVLAPSLDSGRFTVNVGPAIIVLACGALFAAIALLWASIRTLSGDAPLPAGFEAGTL